MNGRLLKMLLATGAATFALSSSASAAVNFAPFSPFAANDPDFLAVGDLNADGISDIVTASANSTEISGLISNGDGTLQAPENTPGAGSAFTAIAVGDVNGDGRADAVVTARMPAPRVWVYPGLGNGRFDTPVGYVPGTDPNDVVLGDLDGDQDLDMVTADMGSQQASVFRNNGGFVFAGLGGVTTVGMNPQGVAIADFNNDGDNDLAIAAKDGTEGISYAENNGNATFAPASSTPLADPEHPVAADFNADGLADLAVSRPDLGDLAVLTSNGTGFSAQVLDPDGAAGQSERPATADLDGDGDPEIAVPYQSGLQAEKIAVLLGGSGSDFTTGSFELVVEDPTEVVITDLNRDGNPDLVSASDGPNGVSVLLARAPTVSLPNVDFGNQQQGVASAQRNVTLTNNGPQRLRPGAVSLGGANPDQFSIVANTCSGANLPIGGSCNVGVTFTPNGVGARSATVAIASNGGGSPNIASLTGTGVLAIGPDGTCVDDINGTPAADTINGTDRGDNIFGFGGNDILNGLGGRDCLTGANGNDRLNGGDANDTLEGGAGNDVASGGNGSDRANGGSGRDRVSGGAANDSLNGSSGNDSLSGGTGNDRLSGSTGNDRITGGAGKNRYSGGSGNDTINARNRRNEVIDCGTGRDRVTADRRDRVRRCERVRRR